MEIRILEADEHPHYELKISDEHIHKTFVRDASPVFHRTKYLNQLMQEAEGAIVGIWDTDVLLPKEQILEAVDAIRKGNAVMSFPYDGRFYMLPQEDSMLLKKREMNMEECCQKIYEYVLAHGPNSVGGAFLVNKNVYIKYGGENQHFLWLGTGGCGTLQAYGDTWLTHLSGSRTTPAFVSSQNAELLVW